MAGHSQFKNIMHRKGRQDAARSKLFSSLSREITVAAKSGGPEPDNNARLRLAIQNARAQSVPKDNIERAIRKSQGGDQENYDEIRYEGYGPGGVAILVEVLSDNRNRSTSNIRSYFSKYGGALGESGSVAFAFDRMGEIVYPADIADEAGMLEIAIDVGAEDVLSDQNGHSIFCAFADLHQVSDALQARLGPAQSVKPIWRPQNLVPLSGDEAASLIKLISVLEADDDVQNVFANFDIAADMLDSLMAG